MKYYPGTTDPIKPGHLVVIKSGKAYGNSANVVTKVTKVNVFGHPPMFDDDEKLILCEAMRDIIENRHYQSGNPSLVKRVKTPSWFEYIEDVRPANEDERRRYFNMKKEWYENHSVEL